MSGLTLKARQKVGSVTRITGNCNNRMIRHDNHDKVCGNYVFVTIWHCANLWYGVGNVSPCNQCIYNNILVSSNHIWVILYDRNRYKKHTAA